MNAFRLFLASLPLALLALNGCAFGGGDIQQNYVLPVPTIETSGKPLPLNMQVMPVEVATGLDTTRIALIENDVQMNYLADSRWAEPLPQMLQDLWAEALKQSRLTASVSSDETGAKADRLIHIKANAFNAVRNANGDIVVHIDYEAKVLAPLTRAVLSVEEVNIEQKAPSPGQDSVMRTFNTANATAMRKLMQKLSIGIKKAY